MPNTGVYIFYMKNQKIPEHKRNCMQQKNHIPKNLHAKKSVVFSKKCWFYHNTMNSKYFQASTV